MRYNERGVNMIKRTEILNEKPTPRYNYRLWDRERLKFLIINTVPTSSFNTRVSRREHSSQRVRENNFHKSFSETIVHKHSFRVVVKLGGFSVVVVGGKNVFILCFRGVVGKMNVFTPCWVWEPSLLISRPETNRRSSPPGCRRQWSRDLQRRKRKIRNSNFELK